jgi:hypothetical protein
MGDFTLWLDGSHLPLFFPLSYNPELFKSKNFATATEDECPQSIVTVYSR